MHAKSSRKRSFSLCLPVYGGDLSRLLPYEQTSVQPLGEVVLRVGEEDNACMSVQRHKNTQTMQKVSSKYTQCRYVFRLRASGVTRLAFKEARLFPIFSTDNRHGVDAVACRMCSNIRFDMHICMHARTQHRHEHRHRHPHTHTCMHACQYAQVCTQTNLRMFVCMHVNMRRCRPVSDSCHTAHTLRSRVTSRRIESKYICAVSGGYRYIS